ncbi:transposase [Rickettsia asembonensis]|nr:transposase [Rickettsia asembonensis]
MSFIESPFLFLENSTPFVDCFWGGLPVNYAYWNNLMIFLEYPEEIRKVIYTTNAVEAVNSQLRKVTKNKRVFPNDNAVFKTLYLAIEYMTKK